MKIAFAVVIMFFFRTGTLFAQSASTDGKTFAVTLFIKGEEEARDTLMFQSSDMQFATAKSYGFVAQSFKVKDKKENTVFTAVYRSNKNGDMIWDGKVMNDSIAGTLIWARRVENPVNYTFTGKLIK